MKRPMIHIHDAITKQDTIREMNDEEYAQHLKDLADFEAEQAITE